ncbi:MAG: HDIG domain-containing protein [Treponema sp.]|jgi:putative nucleotidyltransferase with HDIG domain|nr:HDIG domain-containing protein [Treponema sp.]
MMKKTHNSLAGIFLNFLFNEFKKFNFLRLGLAPGMVCLGSFIVAAFFIVTNINVDSERPGDFSDFEVGKVADRDLIAEHPFSYIDKEATRLRMEAQESLVPAVFRYSSAATDEILKSWNEFCDFTDALIAREASAEISAASLRLAVQAEYPAYFTAETLNAYFASPQRAEFRDYGLELLNSILKKGVFELKAVDMGRHNPDRVELLVSLGDRTEREQVSFSGIVSRNDVGEAILAAAENARMPSGIRAIAPSLLYPFIQENVFFSREDTELRITEAMEHVAAVVKHIEKGKRIVRKGFIITKDEMQDIEAIGAALPPKDPRGIIGLILLLALLYVLFILLQSRLVMNRELSGSERCLLFVLACLYLAGAGFAKNLVPAQSIFPVALFFPTALMVMIPAVFMGPLLALVMALAFPLGACFAGFFDLSSYIFALISGVAASTVLGGAEKRMDLIKAGLSIAAVNALAVIVILLMQTATIAEYPPMLLWAALNGIVSGMLILGILPPLEHALNAATTFRLIELSDLNAPVLRKLFTTAPGTYSHSVMVANLAEQACQDIGANALLARVGAYYHDIGKMENPDYFVENQTDHNRHDTINPRLSATVIRSHVKLGVEKARSLGLPADVINIVAEHHGNSLIMWFYKKATEQEGQVNSEDFCYPGIPPRSKESAVVMLADVAEAAVRTLAKPTVAKMEKFIQQLIDDKVEYGQLAQSDLTFHDLEIIKNAFVKALAGYYHSRIEYPKIGAEVKEEAG